MLSKVQCLTPDGRAARPAPGWPCRCTRCAAGAATTSPRRSGKKFAEGCDVRVDYGLIGFHTKGIIGAPTARGRIPLRSTGLDYNTEDDFDLNKDGEDDVILDYYSHQKYFVIQGTYNGVPGTKMVLTGSSNWASLSTANDEIWFTIRGKTRGPQVRAATSTTSGTTRATPATPTRRRTPTSGSPACSASPTAP